jgi:quercetin dioxygenase-like cupin family protein
MPERSYRPPLGFDGRTLIQVDTTNDIAEFLTSRRARITPAQAGLPQAANPEAGRLPAPNASHRAITQEGRSTMEITRSSIDTARGPDAWFTGDVYIDAVAAAAAPARAQANLVHFTPGARTAWHTHPLGQSIYVTEGVGLCQRRGGPIEVIRPGDRVFFEPDEDHWHGAAPNRFMVHLALNEVDDQHAAANWGDKVTDDEYATAPAASD